MLRVADKGLQESISTDIILHADSESKQFYGASLKKRVKQKK